MSSAKVQMCQVIKWKCVKCICANVSSAEVQMCQFLKWNVSSAKVNLSSAEVQTFQVLQYNFVNSTVEKSQVLKFKCVMYYIQCKCVKY